MSSNLSKFSSLKAMQTICSKKLSLLLFLFFFILINGCGTERVKPGINSKIEVSELPAQESHNSTIIFSDSGVTKAILWVGHLRMFVQSQETLIDSNLRLDFYNDSEIKTTTLTSKKGRVDDKTKNLYAIGDVVATNDSSGVVLKTEELMWRNDDSKIVSDKFVRIISPTEIIEGYGFESDQHLKNYSIYRVTYITSSGTPQ